MSLTYLLERANLRQNQLAIEIGVSQGTVSQWINGKRRIPSNKLRHVARLLGANIDELVPEDMPLDAESQERCHCGSPADRATVSMKIFSVAKSTEIPTNDDARKQMSAITGQNKS